MAQSTPAQPSRDVQPTAEAVRKENLRFLRGLQQKALRKLKTPEGAGKSSSSG
jgi:hypothetical protein